MNPTPTDSSFEQLARAFLGAHPDVQCEWRRVKKVLWSHTDLICGADTPNEVFASFNRGGQIAVGATVTGDHEDFENFGRDLSDDEVAREAFDRFVELMRKYGHLNESA